MFIQILLPRAAFHLGATVNHMLRLTLEPNEAAPSNANKRPPPRHALLYSTLDGSLGAIVQVGVVLVVVCMVSCILSSG